MAVILYRSGTLRLRKGTEDSSIDGGHEHITAQKQINQTPVEGDDKLGLASWLGRLSLLCNILSGKQAVVGCCFC